MLLQAPPHTLLFSKILYGTDTCCVHNTQGKSFDIQIFFDYITRSPRNLRYNGSVFLQESV